VIRTMPAPTRGAEPCPSVPSSIALSRACSPYFALSDQYCQIERGLRSRHGRRLSHLSSCARVTRLRPNPVTFFCIRSFWETGFDDDLAAIILLIPADRIKQVNIPSLALEDLRVEMKLDSGLREDPTLISGLVAIGVMSIQLGAIWQGLSAH
jgi:hypothetical protein